MNHLAISVQQLSQGYGRRTVLDGVTLEIPKGQTFALLGRNGAGKTTLIRTLLGLLAPKAGQVQVLGLNPTERPVEVRSRVGYLAEDQSMYGWMTADQISRFLAPFYPTWDPKLASSLFDRFTIPRADRIKQLSKGQTVRLGLALALAHRPELVILDDPALGLDPIARKEFNRDVIEHLQAEGCTVFYSSHLLYEVEAVADAVAILDAGKILRAGGTEELQHEVKRVLIDAADVPKLNRPVRLLDVRSDGPRLAVTVDRSSAWLAELRALAVYHSVVDLSLDEIFEAFVIGQVTGWPEGSGFVQSAVA